VKRGGTGPAVVANRTMDLWGRHESEREAVRDSGPSKNEAWGLLNECKRCAGVKNKGALINSGKGDLWKCLKCLEVFGSVWKCLEVFGSGILITVKESELGRPK
jgi:hypothetical protein